MDTMLNAYVIDEVVRAAERRGDRSDDRQSLTQAAVAVARDLLSASPRVMDYIPELALGSALRQDLGWRSPAFG